MKIYILKNDMDFQKKSNNTIKKSILEFYKTFFLKKDFIYGFVMIWHKVYWLPTKYFQIKFLSKKSK
jgi:hypothetical protein